MHEAVCACVPSLIRAAMHVGARVCRVAAASAGAHISERQLTVSGRCTAVPVCAAPPAARARHRLLRLTSPWVRLHFSERPCLYDYV
jgi:hypothetical protein